MITRLTRRSVSLNCASWSRMAQETMIQSFPLFNIVETSHFPTVHKKRSLYHGSHTSPNIPQSTWTHSALR